MLSQKRNKSFVATALSTRIFRPGEDLLVFLSDHLQAEDLEGSVLAITSKLVSLAENRIIRRDVISKRALIEKESDHYLTEGLHGVELTITQGILIPSAGIDESNSDSGDYILYPLDPYATAQSIHHFLKEKFKLKRFAVVLTDSHSTPLRRGVNGIALAHWGFVGSKSLVGNKDLFEKPLKFTHVNVADAIASAAVFVMGEGSETTPLATISGMELDFVDQTDRNELRISPENDLYYPLFKPWMGKKN